MPCGKTALSCIATCGEGKTMTINAAFERLGKSQFRSRFKLTAADVAYIDRVGMDVIERHAADFVREKLAPANPEKDGKQTPMRGHPAFKAMHATAMCCRGCTEKWWKVSKARALTADQQLKAVKMIMAWIERQRPCGDSPLAS